MEDTEVRPSKEVALYSCGCLEDEHPEYRYYIVWKLEYCPECKERETKQAKQWSR